MGNDGGSIPDRRDLVRNKPKAEQADKANQTRAKWLFCALSKRPLQEPIVSCPLGKLYNKDAILEYLLDKSLYGDGENICGHIRSLKDVKVLKLTPNPSPPPAVSENTTTTIHRAPFVCPLTMKEMNGTQPFLYIAACGCVFSQSGYRTIASSSSSSSPSPPPKDKESEEAPKSEPSLDLCPQCGAKYDKATDVRTLNPSPEEELTMYEAMEQRRLTEPTKKSKKRKAAVADAEVSSKKAKSAAPQPSTNPSVAAASKAVLEGLALEEAKRKAGMSEVVKSLYGDKNAPKRKETFMTMGTFTRYA